MMKKFRTENGRLIPAITSDQMLQVDRIAMEEMGPNLWQMMENAGRNLALCAMDLVKEKWADALYVVLAGKGGNGGGGICAARHLANHGLKTLVCLSEREKITNETVAFQLKVYQSAGGEIISIQSLFELQQSPSIIIDALIGYRLKGRPKGSALEMIRWANEQSAIKLSLDVPSGVDASSGQSEGVFFHADQTMTLALPKTGLIPEKSGNLILADIGIPKRVYEKLGISVENVFEKSFLVPLFPL